MQPSRWAWRLPGSFLHLACSPSSRDTPPPHALPASTAELLPGDESIPGSLTTTAH